MELVNIKKLSYNYRFNLLSQCYSLAKILLPISFVVIWLLIKKGWEPFLYSLLSIFIFARLWNYSYSHLYYNYTYYISFDDENSVLHLKSMIRNRDIEFNWDIRNIFIGYDDFMVERSLCKKIVFKTNKKDKIALFQINPGAKFFRQWNDDMIEDLYNKLIRLQEEVKAKSAKDNEGE